MACSRFVKARHDVGGLEHPQGISAHQEPGVIIDHVQDLDIGAAGQAPVGDVGLPALVRHLRLEPDERALGSLLRRGITKPRRESTRQIVARRRETGVLPGRPAP